MGTLINLPWHAARDQIEREYLRELLIACRGSVTEAAKRAGVDRAHFGRRVKALGVYGDASAAAGYRLSRIMAARQVA